jgi:hypothetical protein
LDYLMCCLVDQKSPPICYFPHVYFIILRSHNIISRSSNSITIREKALFLLPREGILPDVLSRQQNVDEG